MPAKIKPQECAKLISAQCRCIFYSSQNSDMFLCWFYVTCSVGVSISFLKAHDFSKWVKVSVALEQKFTITTKSWGGQSGLCDWLITCGYAGLPWVPNTIKGSRWARNATLISTQYWLVSGMDYMLDLH